MDFKLKFPDLYNEFVHEYPEYDIKLSYKNREAYLITLNDGTRYVDHNKNIWIKQGDYLECKEWKSAFLPLDAKSGKVVIKIDSNMTIEITDDCQVNENTKFVG